MGNLLAVASWHADKAIQAYLSGDLAIFGRHLAICDRLRRRARSVERRAA